MMNYWKPYENFFVNKRLIVTSSAQQPEAQICSCTRETKGVRCKVGCTKVDIIIGLKKSTTKLIDAIFVDDFPNFSLFLPKKEKKSHFHEHSSNKMKR
jgi:hypothetical protein